MKNWIYCLLLGPVLLFSFIYLIFFHFEFFENNNPEMLYFKATVIGVVISAAFLFLNLFLILYLSISSDRIYERMASIVNSLERNLKGMEFSHSYLLITDNLDQKIDDAIQFAKIEDDSISNFKDYEKFLLKSSDESLLLHSKFAENYLKIYDSFQGRFENFPSGLDIINATRYQRLAIIYREILKN